MRWRINDPRTYRPPNALEVQMAGPRYQRWLDVREILQMPENEETRLLRVIDFIDDPTEPRDEIEQRIYAERWERTPTWLRERTMDPPEVMREDYQNFMRINQNRPLITDDEVARRVQMRRDVERRIAEGTLYDERPLFEDYPDIIAPPRPEEQRGFERQPLAGYDNRPNGFLPAQRQPYRRQQLITEPDNGFLPAQRQPYRIPRDNEAGVQQRQQPTLHLRANVTNWPRPRPPTPRRVVPFEYRDRRGDNWHSIDRFTPDASSIRTR
jgi:ribosome-binding protein aMBF1 (putative translation factor)